MRPALPTPPPREMRATQWTRAEFVSLDFEATGLDLRRDTIISFGVVPVREGRIALGDAVYELVDPDVPPSPRSITVHGLRAQDLAGAHALEDAAAILGRAIEGRILVAWFGTVEAAFLGKVFGGSRRHWLRRMVDVRKLVLALDRMDGALGTPADYTLEAAALRFGVPVASPHHALDDALVTAQLFLILATTLAGRGYKTVRRLLRETMERANLSAPAA